MFFLLVCYLRDLIAFIDALNKKYGFNSSSELGTPANPEQLAEFKRLCGILQGKLAGITSVDTTVVVPGDETNGEPVAPTYIPTEDETPQAGTTYYTRSGEEGSYEYTEFTGETFENDVTYYVIQTETEDNGES